ncbi:hypothetical protein RHGRI_019431 [Rhododendron griersonianum]|uniref:Uncharacterized protein n=1 Tax=Rhododendron griersonianum TaxID=479676 RepID=A0AAV6JGX2_9ERIC|nr:hypothetical protein RHGRI_019431 [Rhododendron griersonianum]
MDLNQIPHGLNPGGIRVSRAHQSNPPHIGAYSKHMHLPHNLAHRHPDTGRLAVHPPLRQPQGVQALHQELYHDIRKRRRWQLIFYLEVIYIYRGFIYIRKKTIFYICSVQRP